MRRETWDYVPTDVQSLIAISGGKGTEWTGDGLVVRRLQVRVPFCPTPRSRFALINTVTKLECLLPSRFLTCYICLI